MLTYARGEQLDDAQRAWLAAEAVPGDETAEELVAGAAAVYGRGAAVSCG